MSDKPTTRAWSHLPLKVAVQTSPDATTFVPDRRMAVERVFVGSDGRVSEAELVPWLGPLPASMGSEESIAPADIFEGAQRADMGCAWLTCDQAVLIYRELPPTDPDDETAEAVIQPIMAGYPEAPTYMEEGSQLGSVRQMRVLVLGSLSRLSDYAPSQIHGRYMRKGSAQDTLDAAQARTSRDAIGADSDCVEVTALPAIFNAKGLPNCAAAPVTWTRGDQQIEVHVFTYDEDPDAIPWTWARVLRYLWVFHAQLDRTAVPSGLLADGNLLSLTDSLLDSDPESRPGSPAAFEDAWRFAALGRPSHFPVEGMNVVEAWTIIARQAGMHFWARTEMLTAESLEPVDKIYWWPRGAGTKLTLRRKDDSNGTDGLLNNDLNAVTYSADSRDTLPAVQVLGDIRRYELTIKLKPGWLPDEHLDNLTDSGDQQTAVDYAAEHLAAGMTEEEIKADPWYVRYARAGAEFAKYYKVGREWIANSTGRYRQAEYGRYGYNYSYPFDPSYPVNNHVDDVVLGDDGTRQTVEVASGLWVRRPRLLKPTASAGATLQSLGVLVELSWDGSTWWPGNSASPKVLKHETGVILECDDLAKLKPPIPGWDTYEAGFWEAIIKHTARVRVTALIEGDQRLMATRQLAGLACPVKMTLARAFDARSSFVSNRRDKRWTDLANPAATAYTPHETSDTRDDFDALVDHADAVLDVASGMAQSLMVRIPWITMDYLPGRSLEVIEGLNFRLGSAATATQRRFPDIVGIEIIGANTLLAIEDFREFDRLRVGPAAQEMGGDDADA